MTILTFVLAFKMYRFYPKAREQRKWFKKFLFIVISILGIFLITIALDFVATQGDCLVKPVLIASLIIVALMVVSTIFFILSSLCYMDTYIRSPNPSENIRFDEQRNG